MVKIAAPILDTVSKGLFAIFRSELEKARKRLQTETTLNLNWIVNWEVTHRCNLACSYCWQDHAGMDGEDFQKGVETLIRLKPRLVWVSGGEPTLIEGLGEALERIRTEARNPAFILSTHFLRPDSVLEKILPNVDIVFITLDGLGAGNQATRGFDGTKLLDRLKRFVALYPRIEWNLSTVATVQNLESIPELIERVQRLLGEIGHNIWPLLPSTHPSSVNRDPIVASRYNRIMAELSARHGGVRYEPAGFGMTHDSAPSAAGSPWWSSDTWSLRPCARKYFITDVNPRGEVSDCRACRVFPSLEFRAGKALEGASALELLRLIRLLKRQSDGAYRFDPVCSNPCDCQRGVESVIRAKSGSDPALCAIPTLKGDRFDPEARSLSASFIRRFINPRFEESFFDSLGQRNGKPSGG